MFSSESGTALAARGWAEAIKSLGVPVLAAVDRDSMHSIPSTDVPVVALTHKLRGRARVPVHFVDLLERGDVVVLHGGWLLRNAVVASVAVRRGVPFVVTAHGVYSPHVFDSRRFAKWLWATALERKELERALAVHLFFSEERDGLQRLRVHTPTIIAPNGIATPIGRAWDGGSGGYLLWLGRFAPHNKGLDLLIQALHALPADSRPELRLHGPDWKSQKQVVEAQVRELDLERWVHIGDPVYGDDKWELISRSTACVYPSRWEGCSMAVLEAISLGVPTLVTPYAMGKSLAKDDAVIRVGWSPRDVADGILRLASPEAARLGHKASEIARTKFSWTTVAESWLRRLDDLIAGYTIRR